MPEDSSSPPPSDTNGSPKADTPNRLEPASEALVSASESAGTQEQSANTATESASVATEEPQIQPAPTTETVAPSPSQQPEGEAVSQSTQPVSEPPAVPPDQENGTPETDQEKQENQEPQATTEPQNTAEPEAPQPKTPMDTPPTSQPEPPSTPTPSAHPSPSIPSLHYPFYGNYPVTFNFGAQPTEERIKKKYEEWGIVGHNGIDFGLQEGTEILACDEGTVIQAGDNGDHGVSVTVKHSWGTSIYSHLQSFGVLVNDHVTKAQIIGSSGQTGFTTGPHLHFGIQPTSPDTTNGYLGFINPAPYLTEISPLPQSPQSPLSPQSPEPPDLSPDLSVEPPSPSPSPISPQSSGPSSEPTPTPVPSTPPNPSDPPVTAPSADQEEAVKQQAVAMFDARLKENSIKGNQAKKAKRDEAIQKIFTFAQEKKRITNEQIRDLLHVSQSTATDYLSQLVSRGMLKTEGKGKATVYLF